MVQYTANIWLRYEVGSRQLGGESVARNGRNYFSSIWEIIIMPMVDMFIIALNAVGNWNLGVTDAYRVSPESWTMVTLMNQGNPGVAKTYINGAPIQTSTVNDTVAVDQLATFTLRLMQMVMLIG